MHFSAGFRLGLASLRPVHQIAPNLRDEGPRFTGKCDRGKTTPHHRRMGTRVLPRLLQHEERLCQGDLQSRQLEKCGGEIGIGHEMILL